MSDVPAFSVIFVGTDHCSGEKGKDLHGVEMCSSSFREMIPKVHWHSTLPRLQIKPRPIRHGVNLNVHSCRATRVLHRIGLLPFSCSHQPSLEVEMRREGEPERQWYGCDRPIVRLMWCFHCTHLCSNIFPLVERAVKGEGEGS